MNEIKTDALCLRASDVGEANKQLTLFSAENGKISARIRSVKNPKSKLKQCAMPLCFGEYILLKRGDFYTVTGCTVEESFFESWSDVHRYSASQIVLEGLDKLSEYGVKEPLNLVNAVRTLEKINYGEFSPYAYSAAFLLKLLPDQGVNVYEESEVPRKVAFVFNGLINASLDEIETLEISLNDLLQALSYLLVIYRDRVGEKFNSLIESIKILNSLV